ncbi:MAG: cobalamin-binding protein [Bryobacteraceae bacterium]
MRIVSLIASATEIVHALGLGEFQVGRSHECDYPPAVASLPVCTAPKFPVEGSSRDIDTRVKATLQDAAAVYDVFEDVLERLQPTHIVTQTQCEVCAVSLRDVERALSEHYASRPAVVALEPNSLASIWDDIARVAAACGVAERGEELIQALKMRMREIVQQVPRSAARPRVACIEWLEPLMAAGNWVPELVQMLGAENLFGEAGRQSPGMTWQELAASDADVIAAMPCGFDLKRTREEMYWLTRREGWDGLRAVRGGRVYIADGNQYLNRPGPRIVESLRILAETIHPGAFAPSLERSAWERMAATEPARGSQSDIQGSSSPAAAPFPQ